MELKTSYSEPLKYNNFGGHAHPVVDYIRNRNALRGQQLKAVISKRLHESKRNVLIIAAEVGLLMIRPKRKCTFSNFKPQKLSDGKNTFFKICTDAFLTITGRSVCD